MALSHTSLNSVFAIEANPVSLFSRFICCTDFQLLQPSALSPPQLGRVRFSFLSLKPELGLHLKLVSPGFCTLERQHESLVVLSLLTAVYVCAVTFWFWDSFNLQIHFPSEAPGLLHVSHPAVS